MRTLLVCFLVAAAAASTIQPFKGDNSYVYRFDSQVATSLIGGQPSDIQQSAATRLRADVHLSFTNDRHAKVQLQHIRFGELNAELPKAQRVQPLEHFERRELPQDVKEQLEQPMSVSIVDGTVERINFQESDSAWSKNIKRAVLNMIQLNLKRNNVQKLQMPGGQQPQQQQEGEENTQVFTIPEITLEGECQVLYSVQKNTQKNGQEQEGKFNVTKSIDFGKCQRTADVQFGYQSNPAQQLRCMNCMQQQQTNGQQQQPDAQTAEAQRFQQCQKECRPNKINDDEDIERSTFARFELEGKTEKYALKRSSMLSQYVVKAQNPESQNTLIQVVALSELTFKEQQSGSQLVAAVKQSGQEETLMYSAERDIKEKRFYMYGDEEYEKSSPFAKIQKKEQKAAHAVRAIVQQWPEKKQGYELDSALHFQRLVEVIRQSTVKELKIIEDAVLSVAQEKNGREGQEHAQQLFDDALATAATRNTLQVLALKIQKNEISAAKAVQSLKVFTANQHSPSERQSDILEKIAKQVSQQQDSPALKQTAWLSFAASVGKACQDKPAEGQQELFRVEEICPRGKKDQYKKTLIQLWKKADNLYEQILALKAIGNAALDNTVEELKTIVTDRQQPTLIRMEAIDAMRRLRTAQPQQIRQTLLPVFQNQREQPEIRMAAFSMILYTHPEKSILDQLIMTVVQDRSQNVKSFVLTALNSLAKSPAQAEQEIANRMKAALKMAKIETEELRGSQKHRAPIYVSEKENTEEQNIFLGLASIVSPANMIPVHLSASIQSALNGDAVEEQLQISFTQKDLEQWYEKVAEYANLYDESSEEEKETMERRSAKDLRSIYSQLKIQGRRSGSHFITSDEEESQESNEQQKKGQNTPFGMIVLRSNDIDQALIPISEEQLPQVVRKLMKGEKPSLREFGIHQIGQQLAEGKHFRQHVAISINEKKTNIPTTAGLPASFVRQLSAVGSVEGQLKAQLENGFNAELKMRASAIGSHVHKVGVWSPVMVSGVETVRTVELNGPIDAKIRVGNGKLEITVRPPQEHKVRILALHTLPVTYTRQFDMSSRTHREPRVRSVQNWALEHTQTEKSGQNGAISVEGHFHQPKNAKQMLSALYTTENSVHVYYQPSERTPKELILRVSGAGFQKHSQHSRPELDSFYSQKGKGFESVYESDEYENMELEPESERRSKLSTYSTKYSAGEAFKHQLKIEAEARYAQKTHKITTELKAECDSRMKHCKAAVEAERSPIQGESQPWTLSAKVQTVMPENVRDSEEPTEKQSRMLVDLKSKWGSEQQSELSVRVQAEPTKKTSFWKQQQQSSEESTELQTADKWSRFLNKFDMIAEYKLHSAQKQIVQRLYELVKAKLFWQLNSESRRGDENTVRASIIVDPISRRHANITVQTPTERVRAESVELPIKSPKYGLERRETPIRSFGQLVQHMTRGGSAECRTDGRRVRTFDGLTYKAPMSKCWSVLAKDCEDGEQPKFAVLVKKSEEEQKVKVITPKNEIIVEKSGNGVEVKINGKKTTDEEKLARAGVETDGYTVYINKRGISVEFDGEEAKVKLSGMYKNQQCGLCGHYNDEEEDVFRTSGNKAAGSIKEFHRSYALQNEECSDAVLNKHYEEADSDEYQTIPQRRRFQNRRRPQESSSSSEEWNTESDEQQNGVKPVESTQVIEYNHKICFSTEPVKRCPEGVDEEAPQKEVKVPFFCLDRSQTEARRMQRQARRGGVVDSSGHTPAFVENLQQPTKCLN